MIIKKFIRSIEFLYSIVIGRKSAERLNNKILNMALHARGYQNHGSIYLSGEENVFRILREHEVEYSLDIGANVGEYSRALMENLNCKVMAFEPLPKAFESLNKLKEQYPERFSAFSIGLGDHSGLQTLKFGTEVSEIATFSKSNFELDFVLRNNINQLEVEVFSLDHFLLLKKDEINFPRIDYIKIDFVYI